MNAENLNNVTNTEKPLVSVLMTAFNREQYIGEAIESVLNSEYKNFELIIVDDVSKDNTVIIAKKYSAADERVKVYVNEKNLGDYPNRNTAARYAKGEFLLYVDSDDKIYPDSIGYCVSKMQQHPEAAMGMICYGNDELKDTVVKKQESVRSHFFKRQLLTVGPGGTFHRRSFFEGAGRYPEKYKAANDMYYNLKVGSIADIYLFGYPFLFYRVHDGQEQYNQTAGYLYCYYQYQEDALKELQTGLSPKEVRYLRHKNKRRFLVNSLKFLYNTRKLSEFFKLYRITRFGISDIFKGLINL